jgi:hypothetical protein
VPNLALIALGDSHHLQGGMKFATQISPLLNWCYKSCTVPDANRVDFNLNIISTGRQTTFDIHRSVNFKIGNNIITNKLTSIIGIIQLELLNLQYPKYKSMTKSMIVKT